MSTTEYLNRVQETGAKGWPVYKYKQNSKTHTCIHTHKQPKALNKHFTLGIPHVYFRKLINIVELTEFFNIFL